MPKAGEIRVLDHRHRANSEQLSAPVIPIRRSIPVDQPAVAVAEKAWSDDVADRRALVWVASQADLVEFLALAINAEDADVADVMVSAGVDAARDLDR